MLQGACHCGAVNLTLPRLPQSITEGNCSICRRLGARWAYYRARLVGLSGATESYVWGDRMIGLHHCPTCGCTTHWKALKPDRINRMGVNIRLFDPAAMASVRVRRFDCADTWEFLD